MKETIIGNIEESKIINYEEKRKNLERIYQEYTNSLISLGFNPEGKDLLEIITFLANELNKTRAELAELKDYTRNTFYKFSYGDLSL